MARQLCNQCHYPIVTCVCHAVYPSNNHIRVVVLQHPDEVLNKKNTIRLAMLSLTNIEVIVGQDPQDFMPRFNQLEVSKTALLFPREDAINIARLPEFNRGNSQNPKPNKAEPKLQQDTNCQQITTLIVIDGTWRKAKKIYALNPWLGQLTHIQLSDEFTNQYVIRATKVENSLSSLEAIAYSLEKLENLAPNNLLNLLNAFTVEFTKNMPDEVRQRYEINKD